MMKILEDFARLMLALAAVMLMIVWTPVLAVTQFVGAVFEKLLRWSLRIEEDET